MECLFELFKLHEQSEDENLSNNRSNPYDIRGVYQGRQLFLLQKMVRFSILVYPLTYLPCISIRLYGFLNSI